jgi:small-conductance mechanosensitive channel
LQGEELIVSNKELTAGNIRNFRKLEKRRITFTIGIAYGLRPEKLRKIPQMITDIIKGTENAEFERSHFTEFGEYSLKILTSYYVTSPLYGVYLDVQQKINFKINEALAKEGIKLAYLTNIAYAKNTL